MTQGPPDKEDVPGSCCSLLGRKKPCYSQMPYRNQVHRNRVQRDGGEFTSRSRMRSLAAMRWPKGGNNFPEWKAGQRETVAAPTA